MKNLIMLTALLSMFACKKKSDQDAMKTPQKKGYVVVKTRFEAPIGERAKSSIHLSKSDPRVPMGRNQVYFLFDTLVSLPYERMDTIRTGNTYSASVKESGFTNTIRRLIFTANDKVLFDSQGVTVPYEWIAE
jgi:hypothetical protein